MKLKMIQTGYLLGLSLLLTSIIYFFASNWQYFGRLTKISLSLLLLLLFYGLHFLLKKWMAHQRFLSNWMLVAASIVFGISITLIGQVYNSHADSYQLFLVWLIPVLLLALLTKYEPFYVLSYVLAHLSFFFFIFPSTYLPEWTNTSLLVMFLTMIVANGFIFYCCYKDFLSSKTIFYLSFILFHAMFFYVCLNEELPFLILTNIVYIIILTFSSYYWFKHRNKKDLAIITAVFAAIYVIYRIFYWVFLHLGELILYILLLFAIMLVFASVVIVGLLTKSKMNRFFTQLLTITVTIMATLFATLAITGLFFITIPNATLDMLFFFALFALIIPGLFTRWPVQIRYTLLGTGFLIGFITAIFTDSSIYQYILFILVCFSVYVVKMTGIKVLAYMFANVIAFYILVTLGSFQMVYCVIFVLNVGYYVLQTKEKATNYMAFLIALLSLMSLTFLNVAVWLQIVYNLAFIIATTTLLFTLNRTTKKWEWGTAFVLWFGFLSYNYYDYLWTLIHKSIVALVLGALFISIAYYFDRRFHREKEPEGTFVSYKTSLLLGVIILQLGLIGYQAGSSEKLLAEGDLIKLELEPIDPRSMLQGDYIWLRYDINDLSNLEENQVHGFWNKKIKIVLQENDGIYSYGDYYFIEGKWNKTYEKQPGDIIINGKSHHLTNITYGIESFFVPEGTGWDLQNKVEYAYVRVGKSGNAILEKVE